MAMLLLISHLYGVRLMLSLFSIFFSLFYSFLLLLCLILSFFFVVIFYLSLFILFLVIQSDLEKIFKNCDKNFHCKHILSVKDYGKLGILYDEKLGGFILEKKEDLFP